MKFAGQLFDVYVGFTESKQVKRKQVSVGSRVCKKAVDRNKLKRQMREIIGQFFLPDGRYVRVVAKGNASGRKFSDLKADLEKILKRL